MSWQGIQPPSFAIYFQPACPGSPSATACSIASPPRTSHTSLKAQLCSLPCLCLCHPAPGELFNTQWKWRLWQEPFSLHYRLPHFPQAGPTRDAIPQYVHRGALWDCLLRSTSIPPLHLGSRPRAWKVGGVSLKIRSEWILMWYTLSASKLFLSNPYHNWNYKCIDVIIRLVSISL